MLQLWVLIFVEGWDKVPPKNDIIIFPVHISEYSHPPRAPPILDLIIMFPITQPCLPTEPTLMLSFSVEGP